MQSKNKFNGYKIYSKIEEIRLYLSDLSPFIIPILFATIITAGLHYFLGIFIAVLFNTIISFLAYSYLFFYGKSSIKITFEFLIGVVLIICLLLFIDIGPILFLKYLKTGQFNNTYFLIWASILLGVPTVYYSFLFARYYLYTWSISKNYVYVRFTIHHDRELLSYIDEVQFANTHTKRRSNIEIGKILSFYSKEELYEMDIPTRNRILKEKPFDQTIYLPIGSNKLFLSWYSIIEDKYYDIEVHFPFEKIEITRDKYPTNIHPLLRNKKIKPLQLQIFKNGGMRLFNNDHILINQKSNESCPISAELRKQKIEKHRLSHHYYKDPQAFTELIDKVRNANDIEERHLIQHLPLSWSMEIMNIEGEHKFEIMDVSFNSYTTEMEELQNVSLRYLPTRLVVIYQGDYLYPYLTVHIHSQSLYQHIQKLTKGDHSLPIQFIVYPNSLKFVITVGNKTEIMFDFEVVIAEKHWYHKYTSQQINLLINEAWKLVWSGKYEQAQEKCNEVIDLNPKYGFAYFLKLRLIWYQKGFEACLARMEYFINKTEHEPPALAHIYNCYGCLYDDEMMYNEALVFFEKANQLVPKMAMYMANMAEIHYKLKNRKKAILYAKEAQEKGDSSNIVQEILKNKGKINEVDFLETRLGRLAVMYRSASDENTTKKIIEQYHETYYKMVKLNKGIIGLDPDAELPDSLMPQEYVNYWLGKNDD